MNKILFNIKQSQTNKVILGIGTHSVNNKPIIYISGETYPIRQQLGKSGVGFNWYGTQKIWWMYKDSFDANKNYILNALNKLNVDVSAIQSVPTENTNFNTTTKDNDKHQEATVTPKSQAYSHGIDVKTDKVNGSSFNTYFPVNKNIFSTQLPMHIDGQDIILSLTVERNEENYKKTLPVYKFNLYLNGEPVISYIKRPEGRWNKGGPNYNEDAFVSDMISSFYKFVSEDNKAKSKLYHNLKYVQELNTRDPELKEFLSQLESHAFRQREKSIELLEQHGFLPQSIFIPQYNQNLSLGLEFYNQAFKVETKVDHPLAPYRDILIYIDVPETIKTIDELKLFIHNKIQEQSEKIIKEYVKYLQSFPFEEKQRETHQQDMDKIVNNILHNTINVDDLISELVKRGYARKKTRGEGYILTQKAINSGYSTKNSAENFYGTIAYWISRKKRNVTSFTEMMLMLTISELENVIKRSGYDLKKDQIYNYLESCVNQVYKTLFKESPPKSSQEQYQDFYSNFGNSGKYDDYSKTKNQNTQKSPDTVNSIQMLQQLADQEKINFDKNNLKQVYRSLALKFHPDLIGGDSVKMIHLNNLWDNIPDTMKVSNNWFNRIKS